MKRKAKAWSAEAFGEGGYEVIPPEEEPAYYLKLLEQEYLIRPERYEMVKRGVIAKYPELGAEIAAMESEWQARSKFRVKNEETPRSASRW